jgi:hypothetical protein
LVAGLLVGASLVGCSAGGDTNAATGATRDDATEAAAATAVATPVQNVVGRLYQDALRNDGRIDLAEAKQLAAFLKSPTGAPQADTAARLQGLVDDASSPLAVDARGHLAAALRGERPGDPGLDTPSYELKLGNNRDSVIDDDIVLKADGKVVSSTGITGHSRGYAKLADGVLRFAHGSQPPSLAGVATPEEQAALAGRGPHLALDAAAVAYGLNLSSYNFQHVAEKVHFDPSAPYWAGLCHAWTYTSLDERLNALVDVPGPAGRRGVWLFGQWVSRADLGNWLMGVSNALSIADAVLVDPIVSPEDWLKGVTQYVVTGGRGLRADIWNDSEKGRFEIWNQPIVSADVQVSSLSAEAAANVVTYARADKSIWSPLPADLGVRLVRVDAKWGSEVRDSYEGPVSLGESTWNMYVVVDAGGKMVKAYMAHHLAKANVAALPVTTSDALPDYFAYPKHDLVAAALEGRPNQLLDNALEGKFYRFFVGTVLGRGVPDATRAAFEKEALGAAAPDVESLRQRFPGVANAYSREQWQRAFEAKLGPGEGFGAAWKQAATDFGPAAALP